MLRDAAAPLFDQIAEKKPSTQRRSTAGNRAAATVAAPAAADTPNGRSQKTGCDHPTRRRISMQERYDILVRDMKSRYGIRINRWRKSTTGCAWEVHYRDGSISRLIEAPYPKGPMSAAVFLHEVGHHAIGFRRYKPRCLEEFKAWEWAINAMREQGLNVTPAVEKRIAQSLEYAIAKAMRRGMKELPGELEPFVTPRLRAATDRSRRAAKNGRLMNATNATAAAASKTKNQQNRTKPRFRILWLFPIR